MDYPYKHFPAIKLNLDSSGMLRIIEIPDTSFTIGSKVDWYIPTDLRSDIMHQMLLECAVYAGSILPAVSFVNDTIIITDTTLYNAEYHKISEIIYKYVQKNKDLEKNRM